MLNETIRHLMLHKKCSGCRYKSFCASHAIPFFRKFMKMMENIVMVIVPVIQNEFQKEVSWILQNMIDGFKNWSLEMPITPLHLGISTTFCLNKKQKYH